MSINTEIFIVGENEISSLIDSSRFFFSLLRFSSQNNRFTLRFVLHSQNLPPEFFKQISLTLSSYMAANNPTDSKRFVHRSSDKKPKAYKVNENESKSQRSSGILQQAEGVSSATASSSPETIPHHDMSHPEGAPARRVVVIRNTKHADVSQAPVDFGDVGRSDSEKTQPVISSGVSNCLFV